MQFSALPAAEKPGLCHCALGIGYALFGIRLFWRGDEWAGRPLLRSW
jgi:hypothetical protein